MIGLDGKTLSSPRLTYSLLTGADAAALREILSDPTVTEPAGFRVGEAGGVRGRPGGFWGPTPSRGRGHSPRRPQ